MTDAAQDVPRRTLGATGIRVSTVALGCWPIAGMTSVDVNEADSLATIAACLDCGVNFLDTAYCYGAEGESERLIARAVAGRRDEFVIATKGGIHWGPGRKQIVDGRPETLRRECETSLRRLETDRVELYYLHAPDPSTPVAESAGALKDLMDEGKVLSAGASNVTRAQLDEFAAACPVTAVQPAYNMLVRGVEEEIFPWCRQRDASACVYWPLMKGLLAGKLPREHRFDPRDGRNKYPMFQGDEWQQNQDLLDALRPLAAAARVTLAQLAILWTLRRPEVAAALCGAKRPAQLRENAGAMRGQITEDQWQGVDAALARRGSAASRSPV